MWRASAKYFSGIMPFLSDKVIEAAVYVVLDVLPQITKQG
jgi:hypothetical protein